MAHLSYQRDDCLIRFTTAPDSGWGRLQFSAGSWREELAIPDYEMKQWRGTVYALTGHPPETNALHRIWHFTTRWMLAYADRWPSEANSIPRIVLDIRDSEISAFDWEFTISKWFPRPGGWGGPVIVRCTPVHAPISETHVTLPLCIRQITKGVATPLAPEVLDVFGSHPPGEIAAAINIEQLTRVELDEGLKRRPNDAFIDILHFDPAPLPSLFESTEFERHAKRKLLELADRLGTRLIVMTCPGETEAIGARWLAAEIVSRGGPAVLVAFQKPDEDPRFIRSFYANLVHNYPLDAALRLASLFPQYATLFVGGGREETLRFSYLTEALGRASAKLLANPEASFDEINELYTVSGLPFNYRPRQRPADAARQDLASIAGEWAGLHFEQHEGEGLLPLAASLVRLAFLLPDLPSQKQQQQEQQQQQQSMWPERFVNPSLWSGPGGSLREMEQVGARLLQGEIYHLGVEIGPKSLRVVTFGAQPISEAVFQWTAEKQGAWIEIGITGLDFEVIGDPVRDLWLPQSGATRRVYFAVSPLTGPTARLRICVYHQQNVVQSLRVVAMTRVSTDEPDLPVDVRRAHFAGALAIEEQELAELGDLGYLPRLEYSTVDANGFGEAPPRTLSLVANDKDGEAVITVKSGETFEVKQSDVSTAVDGVRKTLKTIANELVPGGAGKTRYRFGLAGVPNKGDAQILEEALLKLARVGRALYIQLFSSVAQLSLREKLAEPGIIHVAHVLLEKVIPWSMLYDEDYDHDATDVPQRACLHSLSLSAEDRRKFRCGDHPNCLKNEAQLAQHRVAGGTDPAKGIVCPLHFWGFRHVIEVPGHQVNTLNGAAPVYRTLIQNDKPINAVVAMNQKLDLWDPHRLELQKKLAAHANLNEVFARASVITAVDATDVDIVYLYCHAREDDAGSGSILLESHLEFQGLGDKLPQKISPGSFSTITWAHNPIVFINGCETAGFSPRALSPLVRFFMLRQAAGVIGTEVDVWEPLACEFAETFLAAFIAGENAGDVMRRTRETLLEKFNPLGLVYTLYAPAGLTLQK